MIKRAIPGVLLGMTLLFCGTVRAQEPAKKPFLAPIFTDNMVLQRGVPAPVWGWTTPGAKVTVTVGPKIGTTKAEASGLWIVRVGPLPAGGPLTVKVAGPESVTLKNVLVGDVWICSGQSNMEQGIGVSKDATSEIAAADYPNIRLLTVQKAVRYTPQNTFTGKWDVCTPQTVSAGGWGGFSAVGYYFGRTLNKETNVPIGLIHTSWGGTIAEAWTSEEALKAMPDFNAGVAQVKSLRTGTPGESYETKVANWWKRNDPGSEGAKTWAAETVDTAKWKPMTLPALWEDAGLANFDGIVWFRREITVPEGAAGKAAVLHLGMIDDADVTFLNGKQVGSTNGYNVPRQYDIPAGVLKAGKNVIAVRVLDTGGGGGIYGKPEDMHLDVEGQTLALPGEWLYQAGKPLGQMEPYPIQADNNPNMPTVLYNGMIAPLVPFAIKGAIWYQGESNADRGYQYRTLLPTLIQDWRTRFGVGNFPFLIVQLANFQQTKPEPGEDAWAELREAQSLTAKNVPNTGLAVIIDIGEANDIHPKNKQDVGKRLALNALKLGYGYKITATGPVYKAMKAVGNSVELEFEATGTGLKTPDGGKLMGFALAGADRKFYWADAKITDTKTVTLSSPNVPKPVAVRYAWAINPVCNLYNSYDLPASPFRTDIWPGVTAPKVAKK